MSVSSAVPADLEEFARRAGELDRHLAEDADRLHLALQAFRASAPDFGGHIADFEREVAALAAQAGELDAWVGRVGEAFDRADRRPARLRVRVDDRAVQRQLDRERRSKHPSPRRPAASLTAPSLRVLGLEDEILKTSGEFKLDPRLLRRLLAQEGGWAALQGLPGKLANERRQSLGVASIRPNEQNRALAETVFGRSFSVEQLAHKLRTDDAFSVRLAGAILRRNIDDYQLDRIGDLDETNYRAFLSYALDPRSIRYFEQNDWDFAAIRDRNFLSAPARSTPPPGTTTTTTMRPPPEIPYSTFKAAYERARYYQWWDDEFSAIGQ